MCAAYCMRACVWLMPSIRTLFRFTLEWKLPMFVRVCSNTVSRTGTENHEPTRTMVKKNTHAHTYARAHTHLCWVILQGLWWRLQGELLLAVPTFQPLCLIVKKRKKKTLVLHFMFFFLILSFTAPVLSCSFSSRWENWCERRTQDCGSAILTFQSRVSPGERK